VYCKTAISRQDGLVPFLKLFKTKIPGNIPVDSEISQD